MEENNEVDKLENENVLTNEETPAQAQELENTNSVPETEPETTPEPEATTEQALSIDEAILEKFGNICETVEELVQMANEGLENRNLVISQALESGVHSLGNAFDKNIFAKTFSNMKTKEIEAMGKVWEEQAQNQFSKDKVSKQDYSNEEEKIEMKRMNLTQFKTSNY